MSKAILLMDLRETDSPFLVNQAVVVIRMLIWNLCQTNVVANLNWPPSNPATASNSGVPVAAARVIIIMIASHFDQEE